MSSARRSCGSALALLALVALLAGCGGDEGEDARVATVTQSSTTSTPSLAPIRLGTKDFTEQFILGELYRQALEAKGFKVALKPNIGSSEITHNALAGDALDMYPEYVGVLLSEIAEVPKRPTRPAAAYAMAKSIERKAGFELLEATPFQDANALAVKPAFAKRHGIDSIADLKRLGARVKLGAPPEFEGRVEGLRGLHDVYGLRKLRFVPLQGTDRYDALDAGEVDVAAVFTTEGQLAKKGRYQVLEDPRGVFASQHLAPIVKAEVLEAYGPRLAETVNAVSRELTEPAMRRMNAAVDLNGKKPAEVAAEFLREQGLL